MARMDGDIRFYRMRKSFDRSTGFAKRTGLLALTMASLLVLAGCGGSEAIPGLSGGATGPEAGSGQAASGQTIGSGSVKIALLLPTSSQTGAALAQSLRNASEMALTEFNGQELTILVKDDQGTSAGAAAAAQQAISEGAELILGPLFSPAVAGAGPVAKAAGKPVIAFSSDAGVAQPGVYLLSFLPQSDVNRIVNFAGSKGKKRIAVVAPQNAYGETTVTQAQAAISALEGGSVTAVERYVPGGLTQAIASASSAIGSSDALLILEDNPAAIAAAGPAIATARAGRVQVLGTGRFGDGAVLGAAPLAGAWYPAPDSAGFANFSRRYQAKYGAAPNRVATLAYDAVALANVLTRTQGNARFSTGILQTASGFGGQDGVFRFKSDGTNERALAVFEVGRGSSSVISPAPKSFSRPGT
jgi:ABC-type branched-subunit amino acid transport system substrate-binding protein